MRSYDRIWKPGARKGLRTVALTMAATLLLSGAAQALGIKTADRNERADGTLSAAAARAIARGPLPFSEADVAAKAAADRAVRREGVANGPIGTRESRNPAVLLNFPA
jgi:hypothetical protein